MRQLKSYFDLDWETGLARDAIDPANQPIDALDDTSRYHVLDDTGHSPFWQEISRTDRSRRLHETFNSVREAVVSFNSEAHVKGKLHKLPEWQSPGSPTCERAIYELAFASHNEAQS